MSYFFLLKYSATERVELRLSIIHHWPNFLTTYFSSPSQLRRVPTRQIDIDEPSNYRGPNLKKRLARSLSI